MVYKTSWFERTIIIFIFAVAILASHPNLAFALDAPVITTPTNYSSIPLDKLDNENDVQWNPVAGATDYVMNLLDVTDGNEIPVYDYPPGSYKLAHLGNCPLDSCKANHKYKLSIGAYVKGSGSGFSWSDPVYFSVGLPLLDATLVSSTIPTTMELGRSYNVSVTFLNTGANTWR